ncbi:MAG: class I adenylate-forming enzyme family protein [Leptospirales bacterium]
METIVDYIEKQSRLFPRKIFITENNVSIRFSEFSSLVKKVCFFFQQKGVKKGQRIILYIHNRTNHTLSYFAAMSMGAIPVHVYPEKHWDYIEYASNQTGASMVITDRGFPDKSFNLPDIYQCPELDKNSPEYSSKERSEIAYMMFTSGTTGKPKAVMTTHENILFVTKTIIKIAGMNSNEKEIIFLPLGSTGGLGHLHCCLFLGNHALFLSKFFMSLNDEDLNEMLTIIDSEKVTGFLATPMIIQKLVQNHKTKFIRVAKNLKYLLANIHPMKEDRIIELLKLLPHTRFAMYYGLTEASRSVYNIYNQTKKYSKTGHAAEGVSLKIANPDFKTGFGEVLIKGGNVAKGYWGKTNSMLNEQGWFASGDIGSIDTDGFLTIHGRVREMINVAGMKVTPSEIETVLNACAGVAESAVVGVEDNLTYHKICAAIVIKDNVHKESFAKELDGYLNEKLEYYKKPVQIIYVEQLPKTELGKTLRAKVKEYFI